MRYSRERGNPVWKRHIPLQSCLLPQNFGPGPPSSKPRFPAPLSLAFRHPSSQSRFPTPFFYASLPGTVPFLQASLSGTFPLSLASWHPFSKPRFPAPFLLASPSDTFYASLSGALFSKPRFPVSFICASLSDTVSLSLAFRHPSSKDTIIGGRCHKYIFVATNTCLSRQKWYLWQAAPASGNWRPALAHGKTLNEWRSAILKDASSVMFCPCPCQQIINWAVLFLC